MKFLMDSFWRAAVYCLYPRVIGLSVLPLVLIVALSWLIGVFYWDWAVTWVRAWLDTSSLLEMLWRWLDGVGLQQLKTVAAPVLVIFSVTPLVVVTVLFTVSVLMTPALTRLVADRRFPGLERKNGGSLLVGLWWTLLSLLLALGAIVLTLPMWLVPPLAMVLPALIWGWLTYRVMAFDVLAEFASPQERHTLMARYRTSLLGMGVVTGLMGSAPSLVWVSGALFTAFFVVLVPVAIWIYTLVFAFSSLWFAHFSLAALQHLREEASAAGPSGGRPWGPDSSAHTSDRLDVSEFKPVHDVTDVQPRPVR